MITYRVSTLARASCTNEVQLFNDLNREPSDVMLKGTIYHSLILENKLPSDVVVLNYDDYRTKQAQLEKKEVLQADKIPILQKKLNELIEDYNKLDTSEIKNLLSGCVVEKAGSIQFDDNTIITGRADAVRQADSDIEDDYSGTVYDLKVTNALTFDRVSSAINYSGYDLQLYLYGKINRCNNGVIIFFNAESGLFQQVNIDLGYFTEHCEYKLRNIAIPRLERLEMYKQGFTRELPNKEYEIKGV